MRLVEEYRSAFRGLSREVWILAFVSLVHRSGLMVLPFLALYLTREMHYDAARVGELLALNGLGAVVGIAIGGRASDRFGFRRVQLASLFSSGATVVAMGYATSHGALAVALFVFGMTGEAFRPANMAAIAAYSAPAARARSYGLFRLAINAGWSIGPAIGGYLALVDYAYLFWIDGTMTMLAGVFLWRAMPSAPHTTEHEPASEPGAPRGASPWRDRTYVAALGLVTLQAFVFFQMMSTYPLYLGEQRGLAESTIGLLFAVNTVLIVLVEMPLIHRTERVPPLLLIGWSSLFIGTGFGLIPYAWPLPLLVATIVLWTVGEMLSAPMLTTWVANRSNAANRGRYMAAQGMCYSAARVVAPALGLWLYGHVGPNTVWHVCFALGIVSFAGFAVLRRRVEPG